MTIWPMQAYDIWQIIKAAKAVGIESPVYGQVEPDETHTRVCLTNMFASGSTFGVLSDDSHGLMFGTVSASWYDTTINAYEQLLYVDPGYRGTSLAQRLVRAFEDECRKRGAKKVFVGSSAGINDAGVAKLYTRLGYTAGGASLHKDL